MCSANAQNDHQREIDFLNVLKDDLRVLENTWKKKKLHRKRVLKQFIEIIDSLQDLARSESLEQFELRCAEIRQSVMSATYSRTELPERTWALALELPDLLANSLRGGLASPAEPGEPQSDRNVIDLVEELPQQECFVQLSATAASPREQDANIQPSPQEENKMDETLHMDAKELLQKAQEALQLGNGDSAKELALKAAELISKIEVEEAQKKEKHLRDDLELAIHEEVEAEETYEHLKQEMADRNEEFSALNSRMTDAQSSLEEQQHACSKIKEEIEKTEAELARLQGEYKRLREQFQEALPARDAAERECVRVKGQLQNLQPEMEVLTDSLAAAESQLEKARQKRTEKEAALGKILQRISA